MTKPRSNSEGEETQPWKISVGLTAIILALALMVAYNLGEDGLYIARHVLGNGWLQIGKQKVRWRFTAPEIGP